MGVGGAYVRSAIRTQLPQARVFRPVYRAKPQFSDAELLDFLRQASRGVGGILTTMDYNRYADARTTEDGRLWPGHQTPSLRFGSWRKALTAAGLGANPSSAIAGQRLFEAEHCIDAVRSLARDLRRIPTAREYEEYAAESSGGLPSLGTLRNRCGSWRVALRAALADYGWALTVPPEPE